MSNPNPNYDPESVYPEDIEPEEVCDECGGSGWITVPAHQSGGEIVDEIEKPCLCTLRD